LRVSEVIVRPTRPEDVEEILRVQMAAFWRGATPPPSYLPSGAFL
jgi:hypothetical protein